MFKFREVHAMARARVSDPLQKFKFAVSIPGLPTEFGFTKMSGLKRDTGVVEYNEGGYAHTIKIPGKEKVEAVTLEKGMLKGVELEAIYKKTLTDPNYRFTCTIMQKDTEGSIARKWTLAECWVSAWEGTDLDAVSEDVAIEKIVIQYEYLLD